MQILSCCSYTTDSTVRFPFIYASLIFSTVCTAVTCKLLLSLQMHFQDKFRNHPCVMQKPEFQFHSRSYRRSFYIHMIYIYNFRRLSHTKAFRLQTQLIVIYVPLSLFLSSDVRNEIISNVFLISNLF